jgi:signal transduction histidine kinase/DNA-binding NarL/FixJ family response regulator
MDKYSWFKFVDAGILFMLLTLSLYHIMLWLGRFREREERGHLHLSLITLSLALYSFQMSLWPASMDKWIYGDKPGAPLIEGLIFFFLFFGLIRYLLFLTGGNRKNPYFWILIALALAVPLISVYPLLGHGNLMWMIRFKKYINWPLFFFSGGLSLAAMIPFLVTTMKKKLYRDPFHLLVLGSLLFVFVFVLAKGALNSLKIGRFFYNWQLVIPALSFSYALTRKFNREFSDLVSLRRDLEGKVKERTRELEESRDEVSELHRQRTELFMNLAHETRTPLTLIRYHLDRYREGRRHEPDLDMIGENIAKLQRDMTNFLDSEKLRRGELLYSHNRVVDFTAFVREKGQFYAPWAKSKGLGFSTKIEENLFIKADPYALDRILNNLLVNAVKFTSTGSVTLELASFGDKILLAVADTGRGISEDNLKTLFDPLAQMSRRKSASQGYGLGLFITKRIVEELGGTIRIESSPSRGSRFEITLIKGTPLTGASPVLVEPALPVQDMGRFENPRTPRIPDFVPVETAPPVPDPGQKMLLIVEDHPDLLAMLNKEFSVDYRVLTAVNGSDALSKLAVNAVPDLILSDLMMDVMDGEEFLKAVQNDGRYSSIPFVFLSAADGAETRIRTLSGGAVEFIAKPFLIPELKARISTLIRFGRNQQDKTVRGAIDLLTRSLNGTMTDPAGDRQLRFSKRCEELGLSDRQREISALIAEGLEYKEISSKLGISTKTVTRHVQDLYQKISVHNKMELVNRLYGNERIG